MHVQSLMWLSPHVVSIVLAALRLLHATLKLSVDCPPRAATICYFSRFMVDMVVYNMFIIKLLQSTGRYGLSSAVLST